LQRRYVKKPNQDDAVLGAPMLEAMKQITRETGAFVLGVDDFGKAAETGTRGGPGRWIDGTPRLVQRD
jgi:hypothetical protein